MMNISKKYDTISCTKDLVSRRFEEIASQLKQPVLSYFKVEEWNGTYGVGKPNMRGLSTLIVECADYYWFDDNWDLEHRSDGDICDDEYIVILHDDTKFGVVCTCTDSSELIESIVELINDAWLEHRPVSTSKQVKKDNFEIKPMTFGLI